MTPADATADALRFRQTDHTVATLEYSGVNNEVFPNSGQWCPDLTQEIRDALASGRTRLTLRLKANTPNTPLEIYRLDAAQGTRLQITTRTRYGVVADIHDCEGRLLSRGHAIADMRSFEAGDFLIRVYDPFEQPDHDLYDPTYLPTSGLHVVLEITPPRVGDFHPVSDQDELLGGTGNDTVVGNHYVDRLFGGFGFDLFTGELLERRDIGLVTGDPAIDEVAHVGEIEIGLDLANLIAPDSSEFSTLVPPPNDFEVHFANADLELLIAHQLGLTNRNPDGNVQLLRPIMATDMTPLVELDASHFGISDTLNLPDEPNDPAPRVLGLDGLQYAVDLEYLALAGNEISDVSPFEPAIHLGHEHEGQLGLANLHFLDLDFNPLMAGVSLSYPWRMFEPWRRSGG